MLTKPIRIQIHIISSHNEPEMERFFLNKLYEGEMYKTSDSLRLKKDDGVETVLFFEFRGASKAVLLKKSPGSTKRGTDVCPEQDSRGGAASEGKNAKIQDGSDDGNHADDNTDSIF